MNAQKLEELIVCLGSDPRVKNLGLTKLWKLIYFIDIESLRDGGELITDSEFIKYQHGPVPSRGEKILKKLVKSGRVETKPKKVGDHTLSEVKSLAPCDSDVFTARESRIINSVCDRFGSFSAMALSKISHKEPAWHFATKLDKLCPDLMRYGWEEDPEGL